MSTGLIIVLAVGVIVALALVATYNSLVRGRNGVQNAFSQIDVQLKRRYDLIPNLVETAKGYLKHEAATLEAVVLARNQAANLTGRLSSGSAGTGATKELMGAEAVLSQSLGRLMAIAESYPDLKGNQNMMQLMEELTSTENKIGFARQGYNDVVMDYNNRRETFPNSIVAGMFGFSRAEAWQITDSNERQNVQVKF